MKIIVFIESSNNKVHPVSLETLVAAKKLAQDNNSEVYAVTFNEEIVSNLSGNVIIGRSRAFSDSLGLTSERPFIIWPSRCKAFTLKPLLRIT